MTSEILQKSPQKGKFSHLAFCFFPQLQFVCFALGIWGGGWWLALPLVFLLIVVPGLDFLTGWKSDQRFEKDDFSPFQVSLLHWNTRFYAILHIGTVIYLMRCIESFQAIEIGLLLGGTGLLGGIGFAACHELLHCKTKLDYFIQRIATTFLFYPHYKLIHIRSHHVHAGTEHDENTAWLNESIYAYIFRTIPGSMIRSWKMEASRSSALKNKMTVYALGQVAMLAAFYFLTGPWGLLFYLGHLVGAHLVLESVNYIQHYGLLRKQLDGKYEKTAAEHSWDTYHFFSSYVTFRVGHHSYHHIAVKPYYLLLPEAEAPKLPAGYFWSIPVVMIPPWWRRVANPRLQS